MSSVNPRWQDGAINIGVGHAVAGRVWRADSDGMLTGVTFKQPWQDGKNESVCVFQTDNYRMNESGDSSYVVMPKGWRGMLFSSTGSENISAPRQDRHPVGSIGCECGFWSYHSGDMLEWMHSGAGRGIGGVIHVYGHLTRASKGFRSQYANIVALITPKWANEDSGRWESILVNYPSVSVYNNIVDALANHPLS